MLRACITVGYSGEHLGVNPYAVGTGQRRRDDGLSGCLDQDGLSGTCG